MLVQGSVLIRHVVKPGFKILELLVQGFALSIPAGLAIKKICLSGLGCCLLISSRRLGSGQLLLELRNDLHCFRMRHELAVVFIVGILSKIKAMS